MSNFITETRERLVGLIDRCDAWDEIGSEALDAMCGYLTELAYEHGDRDDNIDKFILEDALTMTPDKGDDGKWRVDEGYGVLVWNPTEGVWESDDDMDDEDEGEGEPDDPRE